eukprot:TCONS_00069757-protein
MDRGSFNDPKLPAYCNSWTMIRDTIWYAVEVFLLYLQQNGTLSLLEMNSHLESLRTICTSVNIDAMALFKHSIQMFMQIEGFVDANKILRDVRSKLDKGFDETEKTLAENQAKLNAIHLNMKATKEADVDKPLRIDVKFAFPDGVDFSLDDDCKEADDIQSTFEKAMCLYYSGVPLKTLMIGYRMEDGHLSNNSPYTRIEFEITSNKMSFDEYQDRRSDKSKALWRYLKDAFLNHLPEVTAKLCYWKHGSIKLCVLLCNQSCQTFTEIHLKKMNF